MVQLQVTMLREELLSVRINRCCIQILVYPGRTRSHQVMWVEYVDIVMVVWLKKAIIQLIW